MAPAVFHVLNAPLVPLDPGSDRGVRVFGDLFRVEQALLGHVRPALGRSRLRGVGEDVGDRGGGPPRTELFSGRAPGGCSKGHHSTWSRSADAGGRSTGMSRA